jgi:hypothetical protein
MPARLAGNQQENSNMNQTDTPLTDAACSEQYCSLDVSKLENPLIDTARRLERDRTALIAALEKLAVRDFEIMDATDCECLRASIRASIRAYRVQS